jgi:hypothetical protein
MKFYQFNVPAGIASIEVRLENRVGNPVMYLNQGNTAGVEPGWGKLWLRLLRMTTPTATYGGTNFQSLNGTFWHHESLITIPNPQPGPYSLSVYGADDGSKDLSGCRLCVEVHAVPPPAVAFDGGTFAVTNQAAGTWQFSR